MPRNFTLTVPCDGYSVILCVRYGTWHKWPYWDVIVTRQWDDGRLEFHGAMDHQSYDAAKAAAVTQALRLLCLPWPANQPPPEPEDLALFCTLTWERDHAM